MAPPYCPRRLMEHLYPDAMVSGAALPLGVDEIVSVWQEGPTLLYQRSLPTAVRRLAIAHGLAHVVLGDFESATAHSCHPGIAGAADIERRADDFAAALLVPFPDLVAEMHAWDPVPTDVDRAVARHTWLDRLDLLSERFIAPVSILLRRIGQLGAFHAKQTKRA